MKLYELNALDFGSQPKRLGLKLGEIFWQKLFFDEKCRFKSIKTFHKFILISVNCSGQNKKKRFQKCQNG